MTFAGDLVAVKHGSSVSAQIIQCIHPTPGLKVSRHPEDKACGSWCHLHRYLGNKFNKLVHLDMETRRHGIVLVPRQSKSGDACMADDLSGGHG